MRNSITFTAAIITSTISFIEVIVAKTQISVFAAEILFIVTGFMALIMKLQNKASSQPLPVKVKAHRKY